MNISTEYDIDYAYDNLGRLSSVVCPLSSETFTYNYLPSSVLISSISCPHDISVTNAYESNRDLITSVSNLCSSVVISQYDYSNDDLGRRTAMEKSGTAFAATDTINYTYNDRSEVISAVAASDTLYNYGYNFDPIGNRLTSSTTETGSTVTKEYTTNNLNQYTQITNPAQSPTYDEDGNMKTMLSNGSEWLLDYNAENRLVKAVEDNDSSGTETNGDVKYVFQYDYMGRRVSKEKYTWDVSDWKTTSDTQLKFVYDGYEQIEELDGKNSDNVDKKRIWCGGQIICDIHGSTAYYAVSDANKNITEYLDSTGTIQAHYEYSPFGKITKSSGSMADDFDYRFSSEYYDKETGLVYYNFRYYSPELGRWLSRDPIGESGGYNLYAMCSNNTINNWDLLGYGYPECFAETDKVITEEGPCRKTGDRVGKKHTYSTIQIKVKGKAGTMHVVDLFLHNLVLSYKGKMTVKKFKERLRYDCELEKIVQEKGRLISRKEEDCIYIEEHIWTSAGYPGEVPDTDDPPLRIKDYPEEYRKRQPEEMLRQMKEAEQFFKQ